MSTALDDLARIAEVEFASIVVDSERLGAKHRLMLREGSYIDMWLARRMSDRFGFHWERQHIDGTLFRYDNFPDPNWNHVDTYPRHFHNGTQEAVEAAPFSSDLVEGFRDFLNFVLARLDPEK